MSKEIVYRIEDGMDREKVLCTTYQMRNFYLQFRDGFFTNLDVMNYIQHFAAAQMAKKGGNVVDVCQPPATSNPKTLHPIIRSRSAGSWATWPRCPKSSRRGSLSL